MKITVLAAAKINLFLDIIGRLDNGYHSLCMLMQSVDLYDRLTLERTNSRGITLTCPGADLPCDEGNLVWKAAKAFFIHTGRENSGLSVTLEKHIPQAAGLAGGSADAAAVLAGLARLYGDTIPQETLAKAALSVGSDVPFCLAGGTMLAQNTGELLTPLPPLADCTVMLAKPRESVSTQGAYAAYDAQGYIYHPDTMHLLDTAAKGDFEGICRYAANVFEQVIPVAERAQIKAVMRQNGALLSQMSGSGPTIFGLFPSANSAEGCEEALRGMDVTVFYAKPAKKGIEFV